MTVKNGRIKQSIAFWCFNLTGGKWDIATTVAGQGARRAAA